MMKKYMKNFGFYILLFAIIMVIFTMYTNLPAEDPRLTQYLHGDVIPSDKKGWTLVTAGGFSIGWGKGDGKILKNHYPKGLRLKGG